MHGSLGVQGLEGAIFVGGGGVYGDCMFVVLVGA